MLDTMMSAAASVTIGAVIGWGANSLTLSGRVDAIEKSLTRIEQLLYVAPENRRRPPEAK